MDSGFNVSDLVKYLKDRLENDNNLRNFYVKGEISNFIAHNSGHFYFTLKDDNAAIKCVMFSSYRNNLKFLPSDGKKVICRASISLYEKRGDLQLLVYDIIDDGIGNLALQFEELKKKLYEQGYFNQEHKKKLVKYPFSIALIAGNETDAKKDVLITLQRRWPIAKIQFYQALVQGDKAADDIIRALKLADNSNHDAIILCRGGGSLEDLWPFNEERLVKFIYDLKTPIITGIGHETDFTLCDFVADVRANTPTGAAELVAPRLNDVLFNLENSKDKLIKNYNLIYDSYSKKIFDIMNYRIPSIKHKLIEKQQLNLTENVKSLYRFTDYLTAKHLNHKYVSNKLIHLGQALINDANYKLNSNYDKIKIEINKIYLDANHSLEKRITLLNAISPKSVLDRGYAIVKKDKKVIKDTNDVLVDDNLNIMLKNGEILTKVISKE